MQEYGDDECDANATRRMTRSTRRVLDFGVSIGVMAVIFGFALPVFADYGDVWDTVASMTWLEVSTLIALAAFSLWTYLPLLTSVLPGSTQRQAFVVNNSSTAVSNTLPAGAAFGVGVTYSMYRSWGFSNTAISLSVIVSGIWNAFVKLGLPIIALAFLAIADEANSSLVVASLVGVAVLCGAVTLFGVILRSTRFASSMGRQAARIAAPGLRVARRPSPDRWGQRASEFRESIIELVAERWLRITLATLVSHLTLFVILLVALRNVGVAESDVSWARVLAAFTFGRLITTIPVTPGGLGVIELGYIAALSFGVGESVETRVVAAVLLFRALTFIPPILIGGFTSLFWKRNTSWRERQHADDSASLDELCVSAPSR